MSIGIGKGRSPWPNATRFSSSENSAKIVGRTPGPRGSPGPALRQQGQSHAQRAGRPGGRPRTGGSAPQFLQAVRLWEKRVALAHGPDVTSLRRIQEAAPPRNQEVVRKADLLNGENDLHGAGHEVPGCTSQGSAIIETRSEIGGVCARTIPQAKLNRKRYFMLSVCRKRRSRSCPILRICAAPTTALPRTGTGTSG